MLDVITEPWDGGDYRLDPGSETSQYRWGEWVVVRALPAPGWKLHAVGGAEWDGRSNKATVLMDRDRAVTLDFSRLPPGAADAGTPVPSDGEKTRSTKQLAPVTPVPTALVTPVPTAGQRRRRAMLGAVLLKGI
jgi:hypothetical protein